MANQAEVNVRLKIHIYQENNEKIDATPVLDSVVEFFDEHRAEFQDAILDALEIDDAEVSVEVGNWQETKKIA